jgi:hypothetical protein
VTGRPKTGGRKRGSKNKRTLARELAMADTAEKITTALGADGFAGDAHALLMTVYKNATQPIELRVLAAKAAIGYEKPRLAAVDAQHSSIMTLADLIGARPPLYEQAKEKQQS